MDNKTIPRQIYQKVEAQNLIVYAIHRIVNNREICTYERLVKECFERFPEVFSLKNHPEWPDSLKLDRPLRTLRQRGLIIGSARGNFELTPFGQDLAHQTELVLLGRLQPPISKRQTSIGRGIDNKIIQNLRQSNTFVRYLQDPKNFEVSETEFRSILRCTLETPERVVKQNLEYHRNVAQALGEKEILQFLSMCEKQLFEGKKKNG